MISFVKGKTEISLDFPRSGSDIMAFRITPSPAFRNRILNVVYPRGAAAGMTIILRNRLV